MQAMNFYTTNSWTGSNYDGNLSTKEIAAKVRVFAKNNFPGFKFSVRSEWSMYTDSVYIELKAGPCAPFVDGSASAQQRCVYNIGDKTYRDDVLYYSIEEMEGETK